MDEPVGKKIVLMPIRVPKGSFCWYNKHGIICEEFDNEFGPSCKLGLGILDYISGGEVRKPESCAELEELNNV